MRMIDKKTKIIATIGPSSESKEMMLKLFEAGMTTIRLNFSHGDHAEQGSRIVLAKEISKEKNLPISILLDTKGPEIRVGKFLNGKVKVVANENITIYSTPDKYKNLIAEAGVMTVSYDFSKDLSKGKIILVDDGKLELMVTSVESGIVIAKARNSYTVKTNKRVNLPGTKFSMPFLSKKDIGDIKFGLKSGIDFIAASFVNTKEDVLAIRTILKEEGYEHVKIISKIESQYAVDHFNEILEVSDGIMIARGDLGLEIPYYNVPVAQRMMIKESRRAGKFVIVATQMLDSMETNPHPTRAEVTDVYFATELGADATMLSGESAAGLYPVEAVEVMTKINLSAEREFYNKPSYRKQLEDVREISKGDRADIAYEVANKTFDGKYKFAIVLSRTGRLLSEVAKFRPNTAIIGVTNDPKQITQFGVTASVFMHPNTDAFNLLKLDKANSHEVLRAFNPKIGDRYLVVENHQILEYKF